MAIYVGKRFAMIVFKFLHIFLKIFALVPLTTVPLVNEILIICWIIAVTFILMLMFINNEMNDDFSIGSLVSCALFVSQILSHIIALGESYFTSAKLKQLDEGFNQVDKIFKLKLKYTVDQSMLHRAVAQEIFWIYSVLLAITVIMTYTHEKTKMYTILYWYSFLSSQALRLRCTQLIFWINHINERLRVIRKLILDLVRINANNRDIKCANMVAIYDGDDIDVQKVTFLKIAYNQIYKMVNLLNDCFGWSLLSICASYFIDFITNCYWIFVAKFSKAGYEVYILNGGLVVSLILLLTVICWHCQECENYSKNIGSSIFKLAKPLGNRRYNNLVSEFSLQALHQQFVVTAKEFFILNLDLLGSMIGAIVTYLVILIQFMFTEKNGSKISVPNSSSSGAVADVLLKNKTITN